MLVLPTVIKLISQLQVIISTLDQQETFNNKVDKRCNRFCEENLIKTAYISLE